MRLKTRRHCIAAFTMLGISATLAALSATPCRGEDAPAAIENVEQLWAGFDPRLEPLEIEVAKSWDEDSIHLEQLYFTGETWQGQKVRVFAYRASPKEGAKLPGILHIHGGGQTASLDWVRDWAQRGYVCVSHDFCGRTPGRDAEKVTHWADTPANMGDTQGPKSSMHPSPHYNQWYHWIRIARRAITLLQAHPQVDPERIGIFGISVGGTLTWMVAGSDDRVKAAAPIYGVGQNTYNLPWQLPTDPIDVDTRLMRNLLDCEAYAPYVTCPLLWLNASNDHHGRLDLGMRTLAAAVRAKMLRAIYTPRYIHHIEPVDAQDLPLWMDYHLKGIGPSWPETPKIRIEAADGQPRVAVSVDRPDEVESVSIYYGLNNPWPVSRFYRTAKTQKTGGAEYVGATPVLSANDTIYAFANVAYRSGIHLSSHLATADAAKLPGVRPTLVRTAMIDPMDDHEQWFWWAAGTDPVNQPTLFESWTGPNGQRGFTHGPASAFSFATVALGDSQYKNSGDGALLIDVWAESLPKTLEVNVARNFFQPTQISYKASPELKGEARNGWLTLRLLPGDFRTPQGAALENWKDVDYLHVTGSPDSEKRVVFKSLRWENLD